MEFHPGVMQRLNATHQGANARLVRLSLTEFASLSMLFIQRHCAGKMNGRRAWGMGPEQPEADPS